MKGYIAKKRCTINGATYNVGDPIPFAEVAPGRAGSLIAANIIAEANIDQQDAVEIPILKDGETMFIKLSLDEVVEGISLLQKVAEESEKAVRGIDNMDLLIFLDRLEARKTVKQAIKERAEKLMKQGDE